MINRKLSLHYLGLVGAIALGAILRFWHLDLKPLWLDEVITALFSIGKNYHDLPLETILPFASVSKIFTLQSGVSYTQIARNIADQSTHPPLFFCWMYDWMSWVNPWAGSWVAKLRALPALFGVAAVLAIYGVNRVAFSKTAGLVAAGCMAVSPFAVYLSQEARHYTLPLLIITLALLGLVKIQRDLETRYTVPLSVWLAWGTINVIGFYVHYFCILAFIAQVATLLLLIYRKPQTWLAFILATSGVAISFLPWLPIVFNHFQRSETDWLHSPTNFSPLYQILLGWVLTVVALPVENQPLPIVIVSGLIMLLFSIWIGWQVYQGLKQLWLTPSTHMATLTLLSFSLWVLLEFFAITYFLNKDITAVPRYNFVYYPGICALLAASLTVKKVRKQHTFTQSPVLILLFAGIFSCVFLVHNFVFQKPFEPERVAQIMNQDPLAPLKVVVAYRDYQDVALGMSFALALEPLRASQPSTSDLAFFRQSPDFGSVWQNLSQLPLPATHNFNLWLVGPGRKRRDYPQQVLFSQDSTCIIDKKQHYRIGVPYQLYRCH